AIKCSVDRSALSATGEDLAFVTVTVVDKAGNPVPTASNLVKMKVTGAGSFEAVANGDPTCLESFVTPQMHLFSGALCFIVRGSENAGTIKYTVSSKGLKTYNGTIENL
ncbi:MAG: beta-galactosidase, partial [Bacteroidales bacterium]|nr:beta-galactosidase [Bacteroidales bacterium]